MKEKILEVVNKCWYLREENRVAKRKYVMDKLTHTPIGHPRPITKVHALYGYHEVPATCTQLILNRITQVVPVAVDVQPKKKHADIVIIGTPANIEYAVALLEILSSSLYTEYRAGKSEKSKLYLQTAKFSEPNVVNFYLRRVTELTDHM